MIRRTLACALFVALTPAGSPASRAQPAQPAGSFELEELTVTQLQDAMAAGRYTSSRLVELYTERINEVDRSGPAVRSVIELNPDALSIAAALDAERQAGRRRGPLHGIPVLIKDNIDTRDRMMTTAGSLALQGSGAERDAFVVERLRDAGAVILGKTNLSEWANFRSTRSTSGWSGRGGQVKNPYVLDRNPCGSSSGTGAAIAANLAVVGVGTETDGSIVCPSGANGLVGIKPTVGLVSRSGIIPISRTQDTAGPMARTVADAAILLGAMIGVDWRSLGHDYGVAWLQQVLDSGLHPGRARAMQRQHEPVGHAVDAPQHRDDVEQDLVEFGVEVTQHRLRIASSTAGQRSSGRSHRSRSGGRSWGRSMHSGWRNRTESTT